LHSLAPNLPSQGRIVIDDGYTQAAFGCSRGRRYARRASADHDNVEFAIGYATHLWSLPCPVRKLSGSCDNAGAY
jgi:hypothetical protein